MVLSDDGEDPVVVNGNGERSRDRCRTSSNEAIGRPSPVDLGELLQRRAAQAIEGAKQRNIMRESRRVCDEYCKSLLTRAVTKIGWVEEYRLEMDMKRRKAAEEYAKEKAERENLRKSKRRERKPGKGHADYEEVPGGGQFLMMLLSNKSKDGGESDDCEVVGDFNPLPKGQVQGGVLLQGSKRSPGMPLGTPTSPLDGDEINLEALLKEAGIENGSPEPACKTFEDRSRSDDRNSRSMLPLSSKEYPKLSRYVSVHSCRIHHRLQALFERREGTSHASAPPRNGGMHFWGQSSAVASQGNKQEVLLRPARTSPTVAPASPHLIPPMPGFSMWGSPCDGPAATPEVLPSKSPIWGTPTANGSSGTAIALPGSSPIWGSPQADAQSTRSGSISLDPWALPESALERQRSGPESALDRQRSGGSEPWWPAETKALSIAVGSRDFDRDRFHMSRDWDRDPKSKRRDRDRDHRDRDRGERHPGELKSDDLWDCPTKTHSDSLDGLPEFFRDRLAPNFIDHSLEAGCDKDAQHDALGSTRASPTPDDEDEDDEIMLAGNPIMVGDGIYQ